MDIHEEQKMQKATDVEYDHLTQCIKRNEPLTGRTLELAIDLIKVNSDDRLFENIHAKMQAGQPLTEYEQYVMVDMITHRNYQQKRKERKARGASYGHITRRLLKNQPLKGKTLELALEIVDVKGDDELSICLRNIGIKIKAGQPLTEYETHIMVDMVLPHVRLSF